MMGAMTDYSKIKASDLHGYVSDGEPAVTKKNKKGKDVIVNKRLPYSLMTLIISIRYGWQVDATTESGVRSVKQFAEVLLPHYNANQKKYKGEEKEKSSASLASEIGQIETTNKSISYIYLKSISDLVGVPLELLMLYSFLCGDVFREYREGRDDFRTVANDLLQRFSRSMAKLTDEVTGKEDDQEFFDSLIHIMPGSEARMNQRYLVHLKILQDISEIFVDRENL
jgi:hypothetical protein